ncbi:DUF2235 domain-containing protein [Pseudomonas sp. UM16]|uniref:DUF2235 domain-containing protein n=1 Tax=Pseudomonas sp. UM16 TaxID=3158962 RepID=UPI00398FA64A
MSKKIILCFDGTWNTPDTGSDIEEGESTNVWRLYQSIAAQSKDGTVQHKWYDEGVGTQWFDKLKGGIFGVGLSDNIKQGYKELIERYEAGDQVYLLGFSRGAYTARSLVGLIRNSGLLLAKHKSRINEAYSLYRNRDKSADTEAAKLFRATYARTIDIHFLGVWDTVGALGIPLESFSWFNKSYYEFHDTELSGIVKNAFQALAVDEWRENYACTMWAPKHKPTQTIEQVWFSGAHANIGGGYRQDRLSDLALIWMMEKATACGLKLDTQKVPKAPSPLLPLKNSYKEFLGGSYSKLVQPYYRTIGATENGQEKIASTVKQRLEADPDYRPANKVGPFLNGDFRPMVRMY